MASIATWLKDILPQTPGVVRAVAKREFMLACREFFEKSAAWRVAVTLDMEANDADYELNPYDSNTDVTKILMVTLNGTALRPLPARPPGTYKEGHPHSYFVTEPAEFHLWPKPLTALADGLIVYVALMPNVTTTTVPDVAEKLFYEALRDGVLGRLYSHPAKAYSDPARAQYHLQRFQAAIADYAARAKAGNGPSWAFPKFGK